MVTTVQVPTLRLTWICTHAAIFSWMGSLSAAWVLKMLTHSLSGARHSRQQDLPTTSDIAGGPCNFLLRFFTDSSCGERKQFSGLVPFEVTAPTEMGSALVIQAGLAVVCFSWLRESGERERRGEKTDFQPSRAETTLFEICTNAEK